MLIDKLNQIIAIIGNVDCTGKMAELELKVGAGIDDDSTVVGDGGFDKSAVNCFILRVDLGMGIGRGERQGEKSGQHHDDSVQPTQCMALGLWPVLVTFVTLGEAVK